MQSRPVSWIKAARKDFEDFPPGARFEMREALATAALGGKSDNAKPLTGFGPGVFEIALKHRGDAWRVVYAVRIADALWVIHAFQKKSKSGSATPKPELDLVEQRLKRLREQLR